MSVPLLSDAVCHKCCLLFNYCFEASYVDIIKLFLDNNSTFILYLLILYKK